MFNKLKDAAQAGAKAVQEKIAEVKGGAKTILVIGATGAQGGSVAKALLADKAKYHVRFLTRDGEKPAAKSLVEHGATLFQGNTSDIASVEKALDGVDGVFIVTQFWEHFSKDKEIAEGKAIVDAIKKLPKAPHVVFSGLENVTKVTEGKITKVAHFDGKGEIAEYLAASGLPYSIVQLASYHGNFTSFFKPQKGADGTLTLTLPFPADAKFNSVDVSDLGHAVKAIFEHWDEHKGKTLNVVSDYVPMSEVVASLKNATGANLVYNPVPVEVFAGFGFPGAEDLAAMFDFYTHPKCDRDPAAFLKVVPNAKKFDAWAKENKDAILKAWA